MARDVFGIVGTTQASAFEVESVVAEGGFGVVYRAHHKAFRATVALKCLKVPDGMSDAQRAAFLEKFREEGELLFRLSAQIPEVVRPLHVDALTLGDRFVPFLALEWLEGESLDQLVRARASQGKAPMAIHKVVRLLAPLARALAKAHRFPATAGTISVIHRDLKPENIFVSSSGQVKILDFGIARAKRAAAEGRRAPTAGEVLSAFTPGYAAPEQWSPAEFGEPGPWTDVYGLAMTIVEVLAGKPPFEGEIASLMYQALDTRKRPTPRASGVVVSDGVEAAFRRALAVDPRDRTQSIEAFWTELERAAGAPTTFAPEDPRSEDILIDSVRPPPPRSGPAIPDLDLGAPSSAKSASAGPASAPGPVSASNASSVSSSSSSSMPAIPTLELPKPSPKPPPKSAPAASPAPASSNPPRRSPAPPVDDDDERGVRLALAVAPPPSSASSRARSPAPRPYAPNLAPMPLEDDGPSIGQTLRAPIRIFFAAVAVAAIDLAWVRLTGERLLIADIRPMVVAGPVAALALIVALFRLVTR